jgi:hypothetical protein
MKKDREPNEVDELLNAVLSDDDWRALNCSLKREALAAIGVARRRRRFMVWMGQAACAAALLTGVGWWSRPVDPVSVPVVKTSAKPAPARTHKQFISEEEMLAMFPPGSCLVAEVNGQKTLVFFDAKKAEEGFAWSHQ